MLSAVSDANLVTKLTSYLTSEAVPKQQPNASVHTEQEHPISTEVTVNRADTVTNALPYEPVTLEHMRDTPGSIMESDRYLTRGDVMGKEHSTPEMHVVVHVLSHPQLQGRLKSLRPSARRAISSSTVELRSHYQDPGKPPAGFQQQLVEQVMPSTTRGKPAGESTSQNLQLDLRSRVVPRPSLDQDLSTTSTKLLRPCIRVKAKSTVASPPEELREAGIEDVDKRLRRVKTVDFEKVGSKPSLTLPTTNATGTVGLDAPMKPTSTYKLRAIRKSKQTGTAPHCPSRLSVTKSGPADPAVTRTDVHAIATAPLRSANDIANDEGIAFTPLTMQHMESETRQSEDVSPTSNAARGLQQVNTKLAVWSGTGDSPTKKFKHTTMEFPDYGNQTPHYDCAVEYDENMVVLAPPNSQRTSGATSRPPSRLASAPLSNTSSLEDMRDDMDMQKTLLLGVDESNLSTEQSAVMPDPDGRPHGTTNAEPSKAPASAARKFSSIGDDELKFRGHRDSVAIAHTRFIHSGGISPDLSAHRESLSLARKRMHGRDTAL